jgi:hypothetical protein
LTLYDMQTNEGAAQLFYSVMTDRLTLEQLARDSLHSAVAMEAVQATHLEAPHDRRERPSSASPPRSFQDMEVAMARLRALDPNVNLAASIWVELPSTKKDIWIKAKLQEALTLYDMQTNEGAAQLFYSVMTDRLTLEQLARDSAAAANPTLEQARELYRRDSAAAASPTLEQARELCRKKSS